MCASKRLCLSRSQQESFTLPSSLTIACRFGSGSVGFFFVVGDVPEEPPHRFLRPWALRLGTLSATFAARGING